MRYVTAKLNIEQREKAYRIYVTDALQAISENTSKFAGGTYMKNRFADDAQPGPAKEEEKPKSVDEFYRDFMKKATKKAR